MRMLKLKDRKNGDQLIIYRKETSEILRFRGETKMDELEIPKAVGE